MKKIVICIILSILTIATVQAQRLCFEPELGFRLQHSEVGNSFYSKFTNVNSTIGSDYKKFWQTDPNLAFCLNAKIKGRWSFTTGLQYFHYNQYIFRLENQPWPVGWEDKKLAVVDKILGSKFGIRYNIFKKSEAKWGAGFEVGMKYLFRQKTKFPLTEDTLPSVSNGYDAFKVFFNNSEKYFPAHRNGIISQYFMYFSLKPYYQITKKVRLISSIDFNLVKDIIIISNFEAMGGHDIDIVRVTKSPNGSGKDFYANSIQIFGRNRISWNFSLGVQIPLIKDKVKKPKIDPALMEGY